MTSLLDIGPLTEEVNVRGTVLTVHGLTAADIFKLLVAFPNLQKTMAGTTDIDPKVMILGFAPEILAKIIATCTGAPGDEKVEAKAKELSAQEQLDLINAICRLSFPEGIGPFVAEVTRLMGQEEQLPLPLSGKGSSTTSRKRSSAALQTDTPGMMRGLAPRVN